MKEREDIHETLEIVGMFTVLAIAVSTIWLAVLGLDHLLYGSC